MSYSTTSNFLHVRRRKKKPMTSGGNVLETVGFDDENTETRRGLNSSRNEVSRRHKTSAACCVRCGTLKVLCGRVVSLLSLFTS